MGAEDQYDFIWKGTNNEYFLLKINIYILFHFCPTLKEEEGF